MIITCKECNSSFNVDDSLIKETGSKVRCSKCENIFVAFPHSSDDDLHLNSDEQLLDSGESSKLDDLDTTLDGSTSEEETFESLASQEDADDELGLGLGLDPQFDHEEDSPEPTVATGESEGVVNDFENKLDMESDPAIEDMLEDTTGALDLDMDLNDDDGLEIAESSMIDDELPNLEEISALDGDSMPVADDDALVEDLDFDLEPEKEATADLEASATEVSEDLGLDLLPEQGNENREIDEPSDSDLALEELDDMALSDLELAGDDATTAENAIADDSEDLDLDLLLDQDSESQDGDEITDPAMAVEETDELDLSDLDLEGDEPLAAENALDEVSEDLDLDLLLDQDSESQDGAETTDPAMAVEETDELDLSDLDLDSDEPLAAESASGGDSEELNLDLDLESETITSDTGDLGDELDLSDLEEIIDSDSDETDDQETQAVDTAAAAEDDDELDFSDLQKILESSEPPEASTENDEADELDLQFDIDDPGAGDGNAPAASDSGTEVLEDGLLDIEKMLEDNDDTADSDLDSQLEMEPTLDEAPTAEEENLELDFDLESELQEKEDRFEGSATADEQLESNLLNSDEAEIEEGEFEAEEFQGAVTTDEFATDELLETSDTYERTEVPPATDDPPSAPTAMMPKSRSKKPVLVALLLLFLAGGILVVPNMLGIKIPYLSDLGIKIPYLSEKLDPKEKDVAGNLKIIPLAETISAKFVNDPQGNQRFVIHGKIKNDYDHPRSFIKVTGKIYQKGGKLAKTESVYCGNLLSDSELTGMKIVAVNKRLGNRFGDKKSNLKVKTGKTIPFMIVFDKLPQNLDEYTVEVDGSSI